MAGQEGVRVRILDAGLRLLREGGREAVSARAVTAAAGVQAPTMYRIFGDMRGVLDAIALHGFETHLAGWTGWQDGADPVDTIRRGWDMHVEWGLENPGLYSIAYGDPRPGGTSSAAAAIDAILHVLIEQAALAGLLVVPVDQAVSMLRAVGTGVVLTLIAMPEDARDAGLSERGREAALASFLADGAGDRAADRSGAAMRLKADLPRSDGLTANEKALLGDWLDRIASG